MLPSRLPDGLRQTAIDSSVVTDLLLSGHRITFLLQVRMPVSPVSALAARIANFHSAVSAFGNFVPQTVHLTHQIQIKEVEK